MSLLDRARGLLRRSPPPTDWSIEALEQVMCWSGPKPPPPPDPPLFAECVIGYRQWIADESDCLWPIGVAHAPPWEPGVNTARCHSRATPYITPEGDVAWRQGPARSPQHAAPHAACHCGLYSLRHLYRGWFLSELPADQRTVVGAVASWGRLEVHRTGIRAEHACIVALVHRPWFGPDRAAIHRIARRYGVEVVGLRDLEAAASRHGAPLPDALHDQIPLI